MLSDFRLLYDFMLRSGCLGFLLLDIVWLFMRLEIGNILALPGLGCLGSGGATGGIRAFEVWVTLGLCGKWVQIFRIEIGLSRVACILVL